MDVSEIASERTLEEQMDFDPFEEQGAWRTSEVAQILMAQSNFEELMAQPPEPSNLQTPAVSSPAPLPAADDVGHESVVAELDLWAAEQELRKLASTAAMAGDVKAAYLIERAIEEMVETGIAAPGVGDDTE